MNDRLLQFLRNNLQTLLLTFLAIIISILWFELQQEREEGGYPVYLVAVLWVLVSVFFLWLGNLLIYRLVRRNFSWEAAFNRRFLLQLVLTLIYSLACINGTYLLFKNVFTEIPPDRNQLILLNLYGILFLIPVLSVQFGFLFAQKWKRAVVEQENLKKERVQSELIALKSHLSPHFLFNNLNILSSLIGIDNLDAQDYLDRFVEVYRYVLKNREVELITVQQELQFLESYRYLLNRRFSDSLQIKIAVENQFQDYYLPPLSLQMVLENALKHNKLSETQPLQITIFTQNEPVLYVQNNLQLRKVAEQEKTGFGLENISRRYWLIARKKIEVEERAEQFSVGLPLIKNS